MYFQLPSYQLNGTMSPIGVLSDNMAHTVALGISYSALLATSILPNELFQYERIPLNLTEKWIRVLDLQPGFGNDPLICDMRVISLAEEIYEPISYCWGSDHRCRIIPCNERKTCLVPF